jgi:hypothetical protein
MKERRRKPYLIAAVVVAVGAVLLSRIWHVPYIDTLMGLVGAAFVIDLITLDEDLPGGLRNPDGRRSLPWRGLSVKGAVLLVLIVGAILFPAVRGYGA